MKDLKEFIHITDTNQLELMVSSSGKIEKECLSTLHGI